MECWWSLTRLPLKCLTKPMMKLGDMHQSPSSSSSSMNSQTKFLSISGAAASTPFANFSKIGNPSGRLNFGGKAVVHSHGRDIKIHTATDGEWVKPLLLFQGVCARPPAGPHYGGLPTGLGAFTPPTHTRPSWEARPDRTGFREVLGALKKAPNEYRSYKLAARV
ncbi:hypothetical protein PtA15_17A81 [Puccinia triticina]|uniref:Uncharacterized protein n=1 Tax=Puccinia triticina TaxID=208348 RepID=A0ABY7D9B0_9BASI|nr:uncharacterized protein PtA15_17A81 [Puccinia triticina]WAQ92600.1 hypothetical protein PtA15_17A81 [Puccinia triticina]